MRVALISAALMGFALISTPAPAGAAVACAKGVSSGCVPAPSYSARCYMRAGRRVCVR
jgi:hypothetical protein